MRIFSPRKRENIRKGWYKFSRSPFSVVGLTIILLVIFSAILAPYISLYPEHAGLFHDYEHANLPPNGKYLFGTDVMGRDVLTRVIFAFRYSLMMVGVILMLSAPPGIVLGLIAGYFKGTWVEIVIMRMTDIFISVPPLILALSICSVLTPNIFNAMMAVSLMWWPWYTRLVYGLASSIRNEFFVQSAQITGASTFHILFKEILPNCLGPVLTKVTLDAGWVILIGASLSFVGLGAQPPTPDLGTMVSVGARYMPDQWWTCVFPAAAIVLFILGSNLLGDGVRDLFAAEEI